jgi:hypothetical protein
LISDAKKSEKFRAENREISQYDPSTHRKNASKINVASQSLRLGNQCSENIRNPDNQYSETKKRTSFPICPEFRYNHFYNYVVIKKITGISAAKLGTTLKYLDHIIHNHG